MQIKVPEGTIRITFTDWLGNTTAQIEVPGLKLGGTFNIDQMVVEEFMVVQNGTPVYYRPNDSQHKEEIQQNVLDELQVDKLLPTAEEISGKIREKEGSGEKPVVNSLENIERENDSLGLPTISALRKLL